MENFQRVVGVLALLALLMTGIVLYAQEETPEVTAEPVMTEEMTSEPEMTEEMTPESEVTEEMTEEATPEPTAVPPTATPTVVPTLVPTATPVDGGSANIVGSGIVNPMLQALTISSGSAVNYSFTNTGTTAGFEQFCAGGADITTAIRTIGIPEDAACREAGVEYMELLIGYDVMVVVANIEDEFLGCLSIDNLNSVFAPSSSGTITSWSQVKFAAATIDPNATPDAEATPEVEELPAITALVPADNTLTYVTLDSFVAGVGLRNDVMVQDYASIISTVSTTSGAIGVVPLELAIASESDVFILDIDFGGGCEVPSITSVEGGFYLAATPLYLYVNSNSKAVLDYFLNYITDDANMFDIIDTGYTPASATTFATNRAVLSGEAPSRAFSAEEVTFEIPFGLTDEINIVGAPSAFRFANAVSSQLTGSQESLAVNLNLNGQVAGVEDFCNGTADIYFVNGDGQNACPESDFSTVNYSLGHQAVVLVANAGDNYAACLTIEQIGTIWGTASTNTVTNWNNVGDSFPEQAITLFGIREGNFLTDILLTPAGGGAPVPVRLDVAETNNDHLYRAAATANVSGSLTYMSWQNYEAVLGNAQQGIQLVAVNAGDGCVVPSFSTITDGSYPLTRQTTMLVREASLARIAVQSYVWTIFTDEMAPLFTSSGFVGNGQDNPSEMRSELLAQFAAAQVASQAAAAEVTAEVTAEATEESGD